MSVTSENKGLINNFLSLTFVQIANNVLPLIVLPFIVRIIGPENYGAINFTGAIIGYFTLLINYAFDLTATRKVVKYKNDTHKLSEIFSEVFYAKILLLIITTALFLIMMFFLVQLRNEKLLFTVTYLYCISLVITPNWLFQGLQKLSIIAILNLVTKLSYTIFIFFLIKAQSDYILQPLIFSIAAIIVGLYSFFWAIKKYNLKFFKIRFKSILSTLWVDKSVFFSVVVINFYTLANLIILGLFQNNNSVAMYSSGWKLITICQTLISLPLSLALFPFIGESFLVSKDKGLEKIQQIAAVIIILTGCMGVFLWFTAPVLIKLFYGAKFYNGVAVFKILCFVPMVSAVSNLLGIQTMINLNKDKLLFKITFTGAMFGILISIFCSKYFGYIGAAWAWFITETFIALLMWVCLYFQNITVIKLSSFSYKNISNIAVLIFKTIKHKV